MKRYSEERERERERETAKMALENNFQVSTVSCARAGVLHSHHLFSVKEKLNLPTCKGLKPSILSFSSSLMNNESTCKGFKRVKESTR